jgi:putative heme transporter
VPAASATPTPPTLGSGSARSRGGSLKRHRRAIAVGVLIAAIVGFVYFVLPQVTGVSATLRRLRHAEPMWIGLGVILEALSLGSYVLLFRAVFSCHDVRIGWRESTEITLAGTVATKLLATAGAGGVALTVWALRASGLTARAITRRMITFELLLYTVFAGAVLFFGVGLRTGVLPGTAPWTLTVLPAAIAAGAFAATLILRALSAAHERRIAARAGSSRRGRRVLAQLAAAPKMLRESTGVAFELVRTREFGILGALGYWAFDMGTLWASLHAFGTPPPFASVVMAYFVGQLANALPLPGGVGGVEGGTIGALIAFGTQGSLAVLGVLAYRLISFWLPTVPGGVAYIRLRQTVSRWREAEAAAPPPHA